MGVGWACYWGVEGRRGEVVRCPVVRPLPVVLCAMGSRDVTGVQTNTPTPNTNTLSRYLAVLQVVFQERV